MSRLAPVIVLLFLSPLLSEFVFGATPISRLESMALLIFLYGGAAVLIREVSRRCGPGWGRIILLGAAYGIFEEGLLIQSMFNPDLFNAGIVGGRAMGVNWIWSLWTVGYHVVYSIGIPILLTEILFPARKAQPWLGWKGLTIFGILFAISGLWLGMVFRMFVAPSFRTPLPQEFGAIMIIIGLVALALRSSDQIPGDSSEPTPRKVPSPWLIGLLACVAATAWFELLFLPHALRTGVLVLLPLLGGAFMAIGVVASLRRWEDEENPRLDLNRLALVIGALIPMMLFGFFLVTVNNRVDQVGQGIASMVTISLLTGYALQIRRRLDSGSGVQVAYTQGLSRSGTSNGTRQDGTHDSNPSRA